MAEKPNEEKIEQARDRGARAFREGKPRTTAPGKYPSKEARSEWLDGWDAAAAQGIHVQQAPKITTPKAPEPDGYRAWPEGEPMPTAYQRRHYPPIPCPKCRAVQLAGFHQAVICRTITGEKAYLHCRGCGENFEMGVA